MLENSSKASSTVSLSSTCSHRSSWRATLSLLTFSQVIYLLVIISAILLLLKGVIISVKLIKWSLRSHTIVPDVPMPLASTFVNIWSIKEKDWSWILVALVTIGKKPLYIDVSR
jgi:hypothetical protein